ncbi:PREDICTED: uncharacterized protein LOC105558108 [Vollenhovia emeryi]|uniref:uncharacterized protein LOC105558108 n=1 Tax=Vollenhovia emeryi TaxID=411798 RepID=UPI0005F509CD|nr:PREDICTED: uncharacterized protein LOC105558108 [Vollenhovia emeryi]XP_011861018.1 PREDICTED: uncharacterized protein LOC105558108 [Vollenhovia emeryi]XP_011861019.1 PREDICTED: uncharacterized protein LOC105558108 [Vollenhovia emeryi]
MSDGMEREKNERLTAREIEEEEMKRELTGIGIYEPGITYKQMKRLLEFVNESQDTSNVASNKKNTQEGTQHSDNECLSDVTSDVNMQQEVTLQECTEIPRPSYSFKLTRTSPTMHERKTGHYINSPESPSLFEARNPVYRRKSSDSDELFEKQYDSANPTHGTNRYLSLRSGNVSLECQNAAERRTAQDTQDEIVQKLERWRLDPLDVRSNENDVPLRQPSRPLTRERIPFEHCKEAHTSDQCDQVIRSVGQHLREMADLWCTWRPITNSIFQWGSPIQVGATNGSVEKKPLTDPKTEQITAEYTYRDGHERASKRKANTLIANLNKDSSTEDEDGGWYDVRIKKQRARSNDKSSNVACATNQHVHVCTTDQEEATSNMIAAYSFDDNIDADIDNERVKLISKKKSDEKDERVSPELTMYPRRIIPPTPKARLSLARQRREGTVSKQTPKTRRANEKKVVEQARDQKKSNKLTEEEIFQQLKEDWKDDEKEEVAVEKDVEIRPMPIPREMRSRLREKRLPLSKRAKETQAMTKEDGSDEELNKKKRLKVCEQRKKEELYGIKNRNGSWEHLLSDDEDESSEMNQEHDAQNGSQFDNVPTSIKNVSCPICNKWFPHNEIEDHAADCEQFETNNEEDNKDINQLECNICNNYKTNNGVEYEEHVHQCISNRNDSRRLHGSEDTVTTSTSSFRNFIPISEQKDSEIDYLGQFPSNLHVTKKNVHTGRKMKR